MIGETITLLMLLPLSNVTAYPASCSGHTESLMLQALYVHAQHWKAWVQGELLSWDASYSEQLKAIHYVLLEFFYLNSRRRITFGAYVEGNIFFRVMW